MIRASIRRPVAVTMAYAAVAALGAFAWRHIPIELLPDAQLPKLAVRAEWRGASPETIEAFLTSPLEAAIQQVRGVDSIASTSAENQATINVVFSRDVDMNFARLDLSERIATLEEELPPGVGRVTVEPYIPEALRDETQPFLRYNLTGPYTLEALRAHLDGVVKPALTEVEGVGVVRVMGGRARLLEVRVDAEAARSLGLTPQFIRQRIESLDLVRDAGVVREGGHDWTVTIANRPRSAADILDAVLTRVNARPVRVRDVAAISDTFEEAQQYLRIEGRPAVTFDVIKEVGSNTVEVADRVKAAMARLEPLAPYGARYVLVNDESREIRRQLSDLRNRAAGSVLVIFLVLFAFLRSFASTTVVFSTITFSVLITLNLIFLGGLSLNLLTLMGLAMGFGLLVDHSIVVLENIYRRWQSGDAPDRAAEVGTREVVLPLIASVATNLIVFLPFVYLQGEMRLYYVPLAVVVGLCQIASLFVGFTFIPGLAARLFRRRARRAMAAAPTPSRPPLYTRFYATLVGWTLRHPWVTVSCAMLLFGGSLWLFDTYVTRGVRWGGGFGTPTYIDIQIRLPRGSDLERTDELVKYFEDRIAPIREVEQFTANVFPQFGRIQVTFPDSLEQTYVPVAIKEEMEGYSHSFTGADVRVYGYGPSFYGGGGGAPNYVVQVLGYNYEKVREIAQDLGGRLSRMSRIDEVDTNSSGRFTLDRAVEYTVRIDRDALARYDLSVGDLVARIQPAIGGYAGRGTIKLAGEEVGYQVKLAGSEAADVRALLETLVKLPDGRQVRLGDVVTVEPRQVLANILRQNQQYQRQIAYEFRGPAKLGDAVLDAVLARTEVPPGYTVKRAEGFFFGAQDKAQIYLVLAISLLLVFMVSAAVFESWVQPVCVLLTVPMGLVGTFLLFFYTNATFTREAYIGVIMAGGIVVNNAILLIDQVNRVRALGTLSFDEAVIRGTLERVRPILMTSAVTVLGLAPLVLFSEPDANIWNALGFTLIGGLTSSTVLVLAVTPALYKLLERGGRRMETRHVVEGGPLAADASVVATGL